MRDRLLILDQPQPPMSGSTGMLSSPQRAGNVLNNLSKTGQYLQGSKVDAAFTDSWTFNLAAALVEAGDLSPWDPEVRALQEPKQVTPRALAEGAHAFERKAANATPDLAVTKMQRLIRAPLQNVPFVGQLWRAGCTLDSGKLTDARDLWLAGSGQGLITTAAYLATPTEPAGMEPRREPFVDRAADRLGRYLTGWEAFALDALLFGKLMALPDPLTETIRPKRLVLVAWGRQLTTNQVGEIAEAIARVSGVESYLGVHMRGGDAFLGYVSNRPMAGRLWLYLGYTSVSVMTRLAEGAVELIRDRAGTSG